MKKWIVILLLLLTMLLTGCGEDTVAATTTQDTVAQTTQAATEPTAEPTAVPTEAPTVIPTENTTPDGLQIAPNFTVYTEDGREVTLHSLFGKPLVLNFWASTCPPCRSEMDEFQMAYDHYGEEFTFVMVNMTDGYWDTVESAAEYLQEEGYTFPVYFDREQNGAAAYGISAIPATYFIDENGGAVAWHSGAMDYDTLLIGMNMLTGQNLETEETPVNTE